MVDLRKFFSWRKDENLLAVQVVIGKTRRPPEFIKAANCWLISGVAQAYVASHGGLFLVVLDTRGPRKVGAYGYSRPIYGEMHGEASDILGSPVDTYLQKSTA